MAIRILAAAFAVALSVTAAHAQVIQPMQRFQPQSPMSQMPSYYGGVPGPAYPQYAPMYVPPPPAQTTCFNLGGGIVRCVTR